MLSCMVSTSNNHSYVDSDLVRAKYTSSAYLGVTCMPYKNQSLVDEFKSLAMELRDFLKKRPALSDGEQLTIENSLLMLQMEYAHWRQEKYARKGNPDTLEERNKSLR